MKTAEEQVIEFMLLCKCDESSINRLTQTEEFKQSVAFWESKLLDAIKEGMTRAYHVASNQGNRITAILSARDNLTSL